MNRILKTFKIKPGEERIYILLAGLILFGATTGGAIAQEMTMSPIFSRLGVEFFLRVSPHSGLLVLCALSVLSSKSLKDIVRNRPEISLAMMHVLCY